MATTVLEPEPKPDREPTWLPKAMISADSHTIEPPEAYSKHIDPAFRDRVPRLIKDPVKGDAYLIDGLPARIALASVSSCGKRARAQTQADGSTAFYLDECKAPFPDGDYTEGFTGTPPMPMAAMTIADTPAGGWLVKPRLEAQDRDGVVAELLYPTFGMVLCNHPDDSYQRAMFDAYNRWLQEFVSEAPTRLFGIGQTALRSIDEGIEDLRRIKEMGFVGAMLPGDPDIEGDWHWDTFDPLWEAAQDLDLPLSFHTLASGRDKKVAGNLLTHPKGNQYSVDIGLACPRANQDVMLSFVLGGVFEKFPKLKLVCVEAGAGWVPDLAARMDHFYKRQGNLYKLRELAKLPSEYFFNHCHVTFQDDPVALALVRHLNPKMLLWANDYPHSDASWPWSRNILAEHMKNLSDQEKQWILHDNVKTLYNLPVD